jgi:hypothetical protein
VLVERTSFFGSDSGGERAAIIYSLPTSASSITSIRQHCPQHVIERIADYLINRIEERLPWSVTSKLNRPEQLRQALTVCTL